MPEQPDILTDIEWHVMFMGPPWTDDVLAALETSPRAAYEEHRRSIQRACEQSKQNDDGGC